MSLSQRRKGAGYENELCRYFTEQLGMPIKRNLGQARDSGNDINVGPFRFEAKRRKSIAVYAWMDQAVEASAPGEKPAVLCRGDGRETLVIMRLEDFMPLLRGEL